MIRRLASTNAPAAVLLIRLTVGAIFLSEGIGCGALLLAGLMTRLAAIPLGIIMLVAIATTKVPILAKSGFWAMAHEARTDFAMLLGCLFLLIVGAGTWSADAKLSANART